MYKFVTRFFLFSLIVWSYGAVAATAQSPVVVEVDRHTLSLHEQLQLKIVITGDFLTISPLPAVMSLSDFSIEGSTSSIAATSINGQFAIQSIYIFYLKPLRTGHVTIPPMPIDLNGQIFETDPIELEVTDAPSAENALETPQPLPNEPQEAPPFIVEAHVDNPTPYLGEQIVYTFRLYRSSMLFPNQPDYQAPPFTNFWSQTVLSKPAYSAMISGTNYSVIEVRTAIFPATLGEITIAPAKLTIPGVLSVDQTLETDPVLVNVRPLPEGAPPSFKGAVGQYTMRVSLDHQQGKVNEPLKLTITLEGFGNIAILNEPPLPELPRWRIFNTKPSTEIEPHETGVYGRRRFERLIFPSQAGDETIPAIEFSYYDPQAKAYKTLHSDPIPVFIAPNEAAEAKPQNANPAIPPLQGLKPAPLRFNSTPPWPSPLYWSGWLGGLILVVLAYLWQRQGARWLAWLQQPTRPRGYQTAQKLLQNPASRQEAALIQQALYTYFATEYNYPIASLSQAKLLQLCQTHHISLELQQRLRTLLTELDTARFAPIKGQNLATLRQRTEELLHDLAKAH